MDGKTKLNAKLKHYSILQLVYRSSRTLTSFRENTNKLEDNTHGNVGNRSIQHGDFCCMAYGELNMQVDVHVCVH